MLRILKFFTGTGLLLIAFALGGLGTYSWLQKSFFVPLDTTAQEERIFIVQKNDNLKIISQRLEREGFLKKWWSLYALNVIKQDERVNRIIPGEYKLLASQTPKEILERILSGQVYYRGVTIPEGKTVQEIAQLMAKTELVTLEEAQAAIQNPQLMYKLNIRAGSFEGYLFPETYNFTRPTDNAESMLKRMVEEGRKQLQLQMPDFSERAIAVGLTPYQVLILASIVEKETGQADERPTIASVFHNRLRIGMPLQSDPTVIYGIQNFDGNLTKEHLRDKENPYNTYVHSGLPATPICNPGLEAIKAVLKPADTDYLYFVSKNDGTHHFSSSYKEHRQAVAQFQRGNSDE